MNAPASTSVLGVDCAERPGTNADLASFSQSMKLDAKPTAPKSILQIFRTCAIEAGIPMVCLDVVSGDVLDKLPADAPTVLPPDVANQLADIHEPELIEYSEELTFAVLPLMSRSPIRAVAVGFVLARPGARPVEVVMAAAEQNWSDGRLVEWLAQIPYCSRSMLEQVLSLVDYKTTSIRRQAQLEQENDQLVSQLEKTYEEISLLHLLTQNLQLSIAPRELARLCLRRMQYLIPAAGHIFWIEDMQGSTPFLIEGNVPLDEIGLARLISQFESHDWSRPLVKNHVSTSLIGAEFPDLENFAIVSIGTGMHRSGWIASCNIRGGTEFGTIEASLLHSIATIFGTHSRNIELYAENELLLLSFVRSFVSTLDAKDPNTRGHSERVALIARRLGEEFCLPPEDLQTIYLAGLLHDIGKIGVDDRILQKPGQLTDEEFRQVQEHPMIGYSILAGLKNLRKVLPGVRNHHEAFNGKGYPDGLQGESIPFMARILAVADSYDAMGSDRPYRDGMPLEVLENILRKGSGSQWDARVVEAYFEARDDIRRISREHQPADGNLLPKSDDDLVDR